MLSNRRYRPLTAVSVALVWMLCFAGCFTGMATRADWPIHDDLPPWAHRGRLRWVMGGAGDMEKAKKLVDLGFNLLWQSYGTTDPDIVGFLEKHGVHRTTYICATSLFWNPKDDNNSFVQFPPLRQATAFEADGTRKLIYEHPWDRDGTTRRLAGCRISPQWLTHQKRRMTFMANGGQPFPNDPVYSKMKSDPALPLHVFFLDNPFLIKCYGPYCQKAWEEYCIKRFGFHVPDPERHPDERIRNAWDYFWLDRNAAYFSKLKAHAHAMNPPRLIAPNWIYGYPEYYYMMEKAEPDIVLVELGGGGERPWGRSEFSYKLALAATDGKALANIWCFPPARPRVDLRRRTFPLIWTGNIQASYLTSAEAALCLASYLSTGPESFNHFLKKYRNLYADAQPASKVAILYSTATELWRRRVWHVDPVEMLGPHWWIGMDYTPSAHVKHTADRLTELGVPYDVIVESDLDAQQLAKYECIVLPDVQCLEPKHGKALEDYVRAGGSVIISQNLGTRDREGNRLPRTESMRRTGVLATVNRLVSLVPATDLVLKGYATDGRSGRVVTVLSDHPRKLARAALRITKDVLPGGAGTYDVKVQYFDSSLGQGTIRLTRNDELLATWTLDRQSDEFRWGTVRGVTLGDGDTLVLEASPDRGELCRIQEVRIQRPAETIHLDKGTVVFEPDQLTQLPQERLLARLATADALHYRWRSDNPSNDVFVNFLKPAGTDVLALHILNATIRDHHHATILDHPECAARKTLVLSEQELEAIKEPVVSLLGFTPDWMQTYMTREVTGQPFRPTVGKVYPPLSPQRMSLHKDPSYAWLIVTVNGKRVGRVPLGSMRDGWTDVPFDRTLLKSQRNTIEVTVTGDVGYRRSYFGLLIDTDAADTDSHWLPAPWPEHQPQAPNDLSPYDGVQTGSYMMLIRDKADKAALPAYAPAHTPAGKINIVLQQDLGCNPAAVIISPDAQGAIVLPIDQTNNGFTISVPQINVYSVLLVSSSKRGIEQLLASPRH